MNDRHTTLDEKIDQLEEHLRENPEDVAALAGYGEANALRGRPLEAMKSYQKLAALQTDAAGTYLALGRIYLDSGLLAEASGLVARVLKESPDSIEGNILLRRLQKSNGALSAELELPLARLRDYLPSQADLEAERARLQAELSQHDSEIAGHVRAVEESRNDPAAEFSLQMARLRRQRVEESLSEVAAWEKQQHELKEVERATREAEERSRLEAEEAERRRREAEEEDQRRLEDERRRETEEMERRQREAEEEERRAREEAERQASEAHRGSKEREEAYAALRGNLDPVVGVLTKTKGVLSVHVFARDGVVVHRTDDESDDRALSQFVVAATSCLGPQGETADGALGRWQFWALDYARGLLILQRITDDYYLLVMGQAGSNFGVLTWTIDKNKSQLEAVLAGAPAVPHAD